jgi:YD repeat-containing protein
MIKNLSKVTLADGSHSDFSYTSWGQVWKVSTYAADNHLLNYRAYNLPGSPLLATSPQTDCPRFTERRDWAQYWNGDTEGTSASNEEAVTSFALPVPDNWTMPDGSPQSGTRAQVISPDGTSNKIYFIGTAGTSSGWRRSLPALVNTYDAGGVLQRQAMTTWAQDNSSISYLLNPRVTETNVYDPAGNRARTEVTYQQFTFANGTSCQLPRDLYEYAANASTKLRSTRTDYNASTTYTDRRIIGLVSEKRLYEGDVTGTLMAKVAFNYDESGAIQGTDAPVQHDNTSYTASFVAGRGNLSSVKRYDVNNTSVLTTTSSKYNTAGAVVSSKDPSNHEVLVSYADSFSDNNNSRNTLAYPTTVTDPDGYSSSSKYHFDFGAVTYKRTPQPNVTTNTPGPEQFFTYDAIGRPLAMTNSVNSASTTLAYTPSQNRVDVLTTIEDGLGSARSFTIADGHGRVLGTASDHPGSIGGYSGQKRIYDVMGRVVKMSNPTETNTSGPPAQWTTAGDDAAAGWIYTEQTYDWKGRPLVTTNPSVTSNSAQTSTRHVSYTGCGCAGGEVVTVTDEGTIDLNGVTKKRQQKIYTDVLGRPIITESLNWDGAGLNGTGGTVYSSTKLTYNARDQIMVARQYAGPTSSTTFQEATRSYDGFGRLKTQHLPDQKVDVNNSASTDRTTWNYNNDGTLQSIIDPRGVITNFTYNARHLPTAIAFNSSNIPSGANVVSTISIALAYDALGNRTSMSDGSGAVNYHYDQLSRMDWEERTFAGLPSAGTFRLNYEYSLGGILKKVTDQRSGTSFTETLDKIGRVTAVSAIGLGGAQTQRRKQWGRLRHLSHIQAWYYLSWYHPTQRAIHSSSSRIRATKFWTWFLG